MVTQDLTVSFVLVSATVLNGLIGGLYVAFATAVMPALARKDDQTFVSVMAEINRAIQNPLFLMAFFGTPLVSVAAGVTDFGEPSATWSTAGAALAVAGTAVTIAGNVPRNNALDATTGSDPTAARRSFEAPWVRLNQVRSVLHVVSAVVFAVALGVRS